MIKKTFSTIILILFWYNSLFCQQIRISITPENLNVGETLQITIIAKNEKIKTYGNFPEVNGLKKVGISSSSSTNFINGKMSSSQEIIQNYIAIKEGVINIPLFEIEVNGYKITSNKKLINVDNKKPEENNNNNPFNNFFDPFEDNFFDRNQDEFIDVEADAFLSLNTSKKIIKVGEGFNTTLSFFVSEDNMADMRFYDLGKQLTEILKKIKPSNCWEENFNIENINSIPVIINNKKYNQYKIFEATYYPFNTDDISFPQLGLELIKYKVSKKLSFFGRNKVEDYEKFYSKPTTVKVEELPEHPLKENIAVGDFKLKERIDKKEIKTGDNFNYDFEIIGEGNITAITSPKINIDGIEFYPPNSEQYIKREKGKVYGSKKFKYYGIPSEAGKYNFNKIGWIFYNVKEKKYDTLKSKIQIKAIGNSIKNKIIQSKDIDPFFEIINSTNNTLKPIEKQTNNNIFLNFIVLILIIISTTYLINFKNF